MIDLGEGCSFTWLSDETGEFKHACPDSGQPCAGEAIVSFNLDAEFHWNLESRDPLTIREYINCSECGIGGRVIEGRWVPRPTAAPQPIP